MVDIYIINSETPKDIALELQQLDSNNNYIILNSKTAKDLLMEIEEQQNNKRILKELKQKEQELENKMRQKPWQDFMFQKTFEPNKLSNKDIENLCLEFYEKFILPNKKRTKIYPKPPKVNIIEELKWLHGSSWRKSFSIGYKNFVTKYLKEIDDEINIKELEWKMYRENNFRLPFCDPLNISSPYSFFINCNNNFGGIVQYRKENYRIFCINFEGNKLSKKSQEFWDWYQKSWDVVAMYYDKSTNTCHVIKKPDEWKIEDNYTKMYYRYGNKEKFFFGMIEVPKWLYTTPAEELKSEDYFLLTNADVKAEFVKKIGIDRLIKLGTVVDSYENYPDNEMWAKSEYKIIDMHEIIPPRQILDRFGISHGTEKPFEYAPFLYMKNQTTGEYHLEGLHPRCKTLYDAIKMRYNGLNIKDYDIKDIK